MHEILQSGHMLLLQGHKMENILGDGDLVVLFGCGGN